VHLQNLRAVDGAWDVPRCDDLIDELETIENLRFEPGRRWPKASIEPLGDPQKRERFVAIIDNIVGSLHPFS
jgi:hypothetical protein